MTVTLTIPERVHELVEIRVYVRPDDDPDLSWLEDSASNYAGLPHDEIARHVAQDRERLDAYNRGEWAMYGVWVSLVDANGAEVARSSGLWGIESDADESYYDEIVSEQLAELSEGITGDLSILPQMYA